MAYELRDNTGSLFRNKRKTEENHPDSSGTVMVAGVEYFIDGWLKKTKDGDKWVSLRFKRKDKQERASPKQEAASGSRFDAFEDPFA